MVRTKGLVTLMLPRQLKQLLQLMQMHSAWLTVHRECESNMATAAISTASTAATTIAAFAAPHA